MPDRDVKTIRDLFIISPPTADKYGDPGEIFLSENLGQRPRLNIKE